MYKLLTIEEILTEYKKRKDLYPDEPEKEDVQTEEPDEEPEIQFIPDRNSELTFSAPPKTGGELKFTPRVSKREEPKEEIPEEADDTAGLQRKKMTTKSGPLKWFSVKGK